MVLLALPPADHLLIERERGQFVPSRRRRMMANARAERLLKIPAEPSPELRIPGAAAQTRVVSMAGIRLDSRKSVRSFKGIICDDISEFESHMPSHAVGSLWCPGDGLTGLSSSAGGAEGSLIGTQSLWLFAGPPPEQGSTIIGAGWDFPGGKLRIGILQRLEDQVDNIFFAPIIRNASDKLRSTVVTALLVVHDQVPLSRFMRCIDIELCFCIVLRPVGRADRL